MGEKKEVSKAVYSYMQKQLEEKCQAKFRLDAEVFMLETALANCVPVMTESERKMAEICAEAF